MKRKTTLLDIIFISIIVIGLLLTVLPFLYIVALSLSSPEPILKGQVSLFPVGFTLESYKTIFTDQTMIRSLIFTIILTIIFTVLSMVMTVCLAYPLTKKNLYGGKVMMFLVLFTMYFSGGIIPEYILYRGLNITNTIWVLVLPGLVSVYNMIIIKSFFSTLPESIEEAAHIDGAGDIYTLFKIVLPLSKPVLATIALFYAVQRWNTFQDALYYITDNKLQPLQLKLSMLIEISQQTELTKFEGADISKMVPESVKSASIIFTALPIICVYPFLQKYFVKGITLGAVKG